MERKYYIDNLRWLAILLLFPFHGILYAYLYCFENIRNIGITGLYIFFGWMGIITLLGIGQSTLNFHYRLSVYLTKASFPVYILHMPILVVAGFFVLKLPTFLIYEIVKRVPVLRFFLGITSQSM